MRKILLSVALLSTMVIVGCDKEKKAEIKTDEDKTYYAIGAMFGNRLQELALNDHDIKALSQGLMDAAQQKKLVVNVTDYQKQVQKLFSDKRKASSDKNKTSGKDYMEKFLKEPGVKKTDSGLAYKIIKPGTGKVPLPTDVVEVHYHGTLIDGTVFDSSVNRKNKVQFPLNRVIKGWTEGLQLIKEGGKVKLVIPSELAYGEHGAPPRIPGGSTLIFEIELFTIKPIEKTAANTVKPKKPVAKKIKKVSKKK